MSSTVINLDCPDPNLYERCSICGGLGFVPLNQNDPESRRPCPGDCKQMTVIKTGLTSRQVEMVVTRTLKELGDPTIRDVTDEVMIEQAKLDIASHAILRIRKLVDARKGESVIAAVSRSLFSKQVRDAIDRKSTPEDIWFKGPFFGHKIPQALEGSKVAFVVFGLDGEDRVGRTIIVGHVKNVFPPFQIVIQNGKEQRIESYRICYFAPIESLIPREGQK